MSTKFHEHFGRSMVKALTYRALIMVSQGLVTYVITQRLNMTLGIMFVSSITSTLLYLFHERLWNAVHWGKLEHSKKKR